MSVKPKVLFLSDSFLQGSRLISSTHQSFLQALAQVSETVVFFHTNGFNTPDDQLKQLQTTLNTHSPNIIISINASGMIEPLKEYITKHKPYAITWFWDDPNNVPKTQAIMAFEHTDTFTACKDFIWNSEPTSYDLPYLPFSSIEAILPDHYPTKAIGFLGTLWHSHRVFQYATTGLHCLQTNTEYFGLELLHALQDPNLARSSWMAVGGQILSSSDIQNAFSAIKRIQMLTWFQHKDLHIYGQHDWLYHLWTVAPSLIAHINHLTLFNHSQMRKLLNQHKVSLNIFHTQNPNGGPNFRILDSAVHGCAILSDKNHGCEQLFPEGEAALYFSNPHEAHHQAERLLNDTDLRRKLEINAANIVNEGHTHKHRVAFILKKAGILPAMGTKVEIISTLLDPDIMTNELGDDPQNTASQAEDIKTNIYYQTETYFNTMPKEFKTIQAKLVEANTRLSNTKKRTLFDRINKLKKSIKKRLPINK